MKRSYYDTSLLIAALTPETGSPRAVASLEAGGENGLISDWTFTEVASALSLKARAGRLTQAERVRAAAAFERWATGITVLPVDRTHFQAAADFAARQGVVVRAADALHLAVCASHGATLATLDRGMAQAAAALGIEMADV